jgi:hypothetical protein
MEVGKSRREKLWKTRKQQDWLGLNKESKRSKELGFGLLMLRSFWESSAIMLGEFLR